MITPLSLIGFDPLAFFAKCNDQELSPAFIRHEQWTIIAWNPSRIIRCSTEHDWTALDTVLKARSKHRKTDIPFIGGAIGCIPYDSSIADLGMASRFTSTAPSPTFFVYDQAIAWNQKELFVIGDKKFRSDVIAISERSIASIEVPPIDFQSQITKAQYARSFAKAKRAIIDGEFYQLNLAHTLQAQCNAHPRQLFCAMAQTHSAPHMSYLEIDQHAILSFSPERFIQINQQKILTSPIKGTAARGKNAKEDERNRSVLLESEKEQAELSMITDLLRNDIGQVSATGSVEVLSARKLQKNAAVWHTYSEITGTLNPKFSHLQALRACLPGGSITGCPKQRACAYIDALEWAPRGMYTGIIAAISDHGVTDSSILIRTIIAQKNQLSLSVGGGIVFDSVMEREWQETFQKAAPFLTHNRSDELLLIDGVPTTITDELRWSFAAENPHAEGVFETLRIENGRGVDLRKHLRRLQKSATIIGMHFPHSIKTIEKFARQSITFITHPSVRMKIVVTQKNILIHCSKHSSSPKKFISVITVPLERTHPAAKSLPYDDCYKAHQKAIKAGCSEALLVDSDGHITEGAYSNIFWVKNKILHTPDKNILHGITREKILRSARKNKIRVQFSLPTKKELLAADEIFLTNSVIGAVRVQRIDGEAMSQKNGLLQLLKW